MLLRKLVQSLIRLKSELTSIFSWWKHFGYRPGLLIFFCFIVSIFAANYTSTKRFEALSVTVYALHESRVITKRSWYKYTRRRFYHEPVTMADLRLYKTSNNFVVKSYK